MDRIQAEKTIQVWSTRLARSPNIALAQLAEEIAAIELAECEAYRAQPADATLATVSGPCCGDMLEEIQSLNANLEQAREMRQDYIDSGWAEDSEPVHRLDHVILVFEAQISILQTMMGRCCS